MNTTLLNKQNYDYKQFISLDINAVYNKKIYKKNNFFHEYSYNKIYIQPNTLIVITNFSETEYELPKSPNVGDSILFYVDPLVMFNCDINFDSFPKIKIYRNGKRIMGLNEHLICDRPFQSLKLSFYTEEDGWIIV